MQYLADEKARRSPFAGTEEENRKLEEIRRTIEGFFQEEDISVEKSELKDTRIPDTIFPDLSFTLRFQPAFVENGVPLFPFHNNLTNSEGTLSDEEAKRCGLQEI